MSFLWTANDVVEMLHQHENESSILGFIGGNQKLYQEGLQTYKAQVAVQAAKDAAANAAKDAAKTAPLNGHVNGHTNGHTTTIELEKLQQHAAGTAPAPQPPSTGATVKVMITKADESALRDKGYSQQQIDQMTPQQAAINLAPPADALNTTVPPAPDPAEIKRAFTLLKSPGDIVELRAPGKKMWLGFYDDSDTLVADACEVSGMEGVENTYWTLQKLSPTAEWTKDEKIITRVVSNTSTQHGLGTNDEHVASYAWLPVDFDPIRTNGDQKTCSTDAEKAAALNLAETVRAFLSEHNMPSVLADSGNGYHLLVKIDLPAVKRSLMESVIGGLAAKFSSPTVSVDRKVFNESRIWKIYGTVARKGPNTLERPWRVARIKDVPELRVVAEDELLSLLPLLGNNTNTANTSNTSKTPRNEKNLITVGSRYDALMSEAGALWGRGYPKEAIITLCIEWAKTNFENVDESNIDKGLIRKEVEHLLDTYAQGKPQRVVTVGLSLEEQQAQLKAKQEEAANLLDAWLATDGDPLEAKRITELTEQLEGTAYETRREKIAEKSGMRVSFFDDKRKLAKKNADKAKTKAKTPREAYGVTSDNTTEDVIQMVRQLIFTSRPERISLGLPGSLEEAMNVADRLIYDDLKASGRFYNVGGLGYIIKTGQEDEPIKISESSAECLDMLEKYHLHPGRPATNAAGKYLGVRSYMDGEHVTQHISFHYDPETHTAYYAEARGTLLKVTKDGVSRIKNGEDGVLFIYPENYKPWVYSAVSGIKNSLIPAAGSILYDAVFKGLTFEDSAMSDQQKRILLTVYLILLFLPGLNRSKILLQMLGPSGSGKSFFLEVIGRLLLGPKFSTQPMPGEPKEFENQVINSSFIAYDNVNQIDQKVKDLLCQVATGLTVTRRELFTTAGQVSYPALATVAFSTIVSPLTEIEHTNRSLVIQMKKRPKGKFRSAVDLLADLDLQRDKLMSELVERVRMVLGALGAQKDYRPETNVRLADVGTFLLRVAKHEGWEDKAEEMLTAWVGEQSASAMEDDDIGQLLVCILRNPEFTPTWLSSSDFKTLLVNTGKFKGLSMDLWSIKSPKTLATILVRNLESYAERFGVEQDIDSHTKNRKFRLNPSAELLAQIRAGVTVADLLEKPDVTF